VAERGAAALGDVRYGSGEGGRDDDGEGLEDTVGGALPGALTEQGVREGAGGTEGRGFPLAGEGAPAGELADGDEQAEG